MTESLGWTDTFPLLYLWSCLHRRLRQATSYSKLLEITWSDLMLDWCLRQSTSHRVSVVYHSYGGMMDMWHRNICWSIWTLIYSFVGQRQDGHHQSRIQQKTSCFRTIDQPYFTCICFLQPKRRQKRNGTQFIDIHMLLRFSRGYHHLKCHGGDHSK